MDDSSDTNELALLTSNIINKICDVLNFFLSFLWKYEKEPTTCFSWC
jgi:hypothetical protein